MTTETKRTKVLAELLKMNYTVLEAEKLIAEHFENSMYLTSVKETARYMVA